MSFSNLEERYLDWMYRLVWSDDRQGTASYWKLFRCLYDIPFRYTIPRDGNRDSDGIELRYRFGYDEKIDDAIIASELDIKGCSVLEMMVALALRCEEQIMANPEVGNRTNEWFWIMVDHLGLAYMDDSNFYEDSVMYAVDIFLDRKYAPDGNGGLFILEHCDTDLRGVEIWYQLNWYLNEYLEENE